MVLTVNSSSNKKTIIPSTSRPSPLSSNNGGRDSVGVDDDLPIVYVTAVVPTATVLPHTTTTSPPRLMGLGGRYGEEQGGDNEPEIPLSVELGDLEETSTPPPSANTSRCDRLGREMTRQNTDHAGTKQDLAHAFGKDGDSDDDHASHGDSGGVEGETRWETKCRRRRRQKVRIIVGGITGLVVGSVILCVPGAILGAVAGVWATRSIDRRRERLKDERNAMAAAPAANRDVGPVAVATHVGDAK